MLSLLRQLFGIMAAARLIKDDKVQAVSYETLDMMLRFVRLFRRAPQTAQLGNLGDVHD
jgi:hypothetical protein